MTLAKRPPGPKGTFLVGHTLAYMRDPLGFLTQVARDYGDIVQLRLGGTTMLVLNHPDQIEQVLRTDHENYVKDKLTRMIMPIVGQGLLTSEGAFWRRQRKLCQPAFPLQQVQRYGEVMIDATARMLESWGDGEERDLHADLSALTLRIVAKTLFDADVAHETEVVGKSLEVMTDYYLDPWKFAPGYDRLPTPSNIRFRRAVRTLDSIIYGIIRKRRESGAVADDLLSRLLSATDDEDGNGMTDRQLRDEAVTLFLAGHETTALALTYCLYLLASNPGADDRLFAEVAEVLGDRPPAVADVPRLRYTEWAIREGMRLYPPAWGIGREAIVDCEIGGYPVRKGTQVSLIQWVVHRDPRWFDDPEVFRPERWDQDLLKRLPRGAYFPFGDGPRICIGIHFAMMEATLLLAAIVQQYRVKLAADFQLELAPSITLRPRRGLRVMLERRRGPKLFAMVGTSRQLSGESLLRPGPTSD